MFKVRDISKEEYQKYCIRNFLDPIMFKLRVEKLGWDRDQAAIEPVDACSPRIWSHEEMKILIENGYKIRTKELSMLLPGRTKREIIRRKSILGITISKKGKRNVD